MSPHEPQGPSSPAELAIALQGSFGHSYYAMGVMSALQGYRFRFLGASACVEMLLPVWLYFNKDGVDIREYTGRPLTLSDLIPRLTSGYLDPGAWADYLGAVAGTATSSHVLGQAFADLLGPAGPLMFNPLFFDGEPGIALERLMESVTVPVFTNALDAKNFREVSVVPN